MITHGIVDGQDALLSYIDDQFHPVAKKKATLLVAILEDGRKLFLKVPPQAPKPTADFNPYHAPKGSPKGGQFTSKTGMGGVSPEAFVKARDKSKRQQFLSPKSAEELKGHKLFMNRDGTVGVSVDVDGDIQNVFNNGGPKGGAAKAMVEAIANGGRTLDAYAGFLPKYYHQFGFKEDQRMKFNPDYAPEGWDFMKYDSPDVVFMSWRGYGHGGSQGALDRAAKRDQWVTPTKTKRYGDDWDKAKERSRKNAERGGTTDRRDDGADGRPQAERSGDRAGAGAGSRHRRIVDKSDYFADWAAGYDRKERLRRARLRDAEVADYNLRHYTKGNLGGQFAPGKGSGSKKKAKAEQATVEKEKVRKFKPTKAKAEKAKVEKATAEKAYVEKQVIIKAEPEKVTAEQARVEKAAVQKEQVVKAEVAKTAEEKRQEKLTPHQRIEERRKKIKRQAGEGAARLKAYGERNRAKLRDAARKTPACHAPAGSTDPKGGQFVACGPSSATSAEKAKTKVTMAEFERANMIEGDGIRREEDFLELWNTAIGVPPEEFKKKVMADVNNRMKVNYSGLEKQIIFGGALLDDEGSSMGTHAASMNFADKTAQLDYLELEPDKQGKGIAKDIVKANFDVFQESGMEKVKIHANIDVGGYAWAKYGFAPNADDWPEFRREIGNRAAEMFMEDRMTGPEHMAIQQALQSGNPKAIWPVADSKFGKDLLLDSSWYGEIDLSDGSTMRRFNAYVGREKTH